MSRAVRVPISKSTRFEVFKRDDFACRYCGRGSPDITLTIDHVEPVVNGGSNNADNLVTACSECNGGKGAAALNTPSPASPGTVRARLAYTRGIVRNRFPACNMDKMTWLLRLGWEAGLTLDQLETLAICAPTWQTIAGRIHGAVYEADEIRKKGK